tara:strand:- start:203 stop:397 length:195 start_codon:yes stop_codon:yes gene_type:complete
MSNEVTKPSLFSYLDKVMGNDGIKTANKLEISVDRETAITLLGIGVGLVIFSHLLGAGINKVIN